VLLVRPLHSLPASSLRSPQVQKAFTNDEDLASVGSEGPANSEQSHAEALAARLSQEGVKDSRLRHHDDSTSTALGPDVKREDWRR